MKKKCKSYEKKLKKLSKELKAKKSMGKTPSSKHLKLKKKLENKYVTYKKRLSALAQRHVSMQNASEKHKHRKSSSSSKKTKKTATKEMSQQQQQQNVTTPILKLPYPVLNDKRDMTAIKQILKEKQRSLNEMFEKTRVTLHNLDSNETAVDQENEHLTLEEKEQKRMRLRNLHENIKLQLSRLNRQIDYVKVNLELVELRRILEREEREHEVERLKKRLVELSNQNEDLLVFMKDENRRFLKQQEHAERLGKVREETNIYNNILY